MNVMSIKVANVNDTIIPGMYPVKRPTARDEWVNAESRLYGSLLLLLGLCAAYGSFICISTLAGYNNGLGLAFLIAAVVQCCLGIVSMIVGYSAAVLDEGNECLTSILVGLIHTGWLGLLVGLYGIVNAILADQQSNPFVPTEYNPTTSDVTFIGSMCFIAMVAYNSGLIGSLHFMASSLHSIQKGTSEDISGYSFRKNARVYNAFFVIAGFAQMAIGSFVLNKYGHGPLQEPITPSTVFGIMYFPEIGIIVGSLQMFTGAVGVTRSLCTSSNDKKSTYNLLFQALCLITFLCMIMLQDLCQVAYAGGEKAAMATRLACEYLPLAFMPAFLDWKMNTRENQIMKLSTALKVIEEC